MSKRVSRRYRRTRNSTVFVENGREWKITDMVIEQAEEIKKLRQEIDELKGEVKIVPVSKSD